MRAEPVQYVLGTLAVAGKIIVQQPTADSPHYLPTPEQLTPTGTTSIVGFQQIRGWEYTGEWLWMPGVQVFSLLFAVWNAYKWLTPLALVWALASRDWLYATAALIVIVGALLTAAVEAPEARIYSWMYPLAPILIGGMIAALVRRLRRTPNMTET